MSLYTLFIRVYRDVRIMHTHTQSMNKRVAALNILSMLTFYSFSIRFLYLSLLFKRQIDHFKVSSKYKQLN